VGVDFSAGPPVGSRALCLGVASGCRKTTCRSFLETSCTKDIFIFIAPLTGVGAPCGLSLKKIVYFKQSESMQTQDRSALWDKRVGMKDLFGKTVFESLPSYKTQIMVVRL